METNTETNKPICKLCVSAPANDAKPDKLGYYPDMVEFFRGELERVTNSGRALTDTKELREHIVKQVKWGGYEAKPKYVKLMSNLYILTGKTIKNLTQATKVMDVLLNIPNTELKREVSRAFYLDKVYTNTEIKTKLTNIYEELGITKRAKHTDIYEFFTGKEKKINREKGIHILNRK